MYISLTNSRPVGFRKWSEAHRADNDDDDNPGGAKPVALTEPSLDPDAPGELPHRPWGIPGVGGAF